MTGLEVTEQENKGHYCATQRSGRGAAEEKRHPGTRRQAEQQVDFSGNVVPGPPSQCRDQRRCRCNDGD